MKHDELAVGIINTTIEGRIISLGFDLFAPGSYSTLN